MANEDLAVKIEAAVLVHCCLCLIQRLLTKLTCTIILSVYCKGDMIGKLLALIAAEMP